MRLDSRGLPDVSREVFSPVRPEALEMVKYIKLSSNALISACRLQVDLSTDKELKRWFAMAATAFEEGSMWAVKGFTYEDWRPVETVKPPIQHANPELNK